MLSTNGLLVPVPWIAAMVCVPAFGVGATLDAVGVGGFSSVKSAPLFAVLACCASRVSEFALPGDGAAVPAKVVPVPKPTMSTTAGSAGHAAAAQVSADAVLTSATFPFVAPKLVVPLAFAVGSGVPTVALLVPPCTR